MEEKNARIFVTSVKNISKKLDYYGDAKLENITLLRLIYKYAQYAVNNKQLRCLDKMVSELQKSDKDICLERQALKSFAIDTNQAIPINVLPEKPIIDTLNLTLEDQIYEFSVGEFFSTYSDNNDYPPQSFSIVSLPDTGQLLYNGIPIDINTSYTDSSLVTYVRDGDLDYVTTFNFTVLDANPETPSVSNSTICYMNVLEIVQPNQPATADDNNIYVDNRAITVMTVSMFTLNYSDPDGDPLDSIRIDSISSDNDGEFLYYGTLVLPGQIITVNELNAGAFIHSAPDENTINTDSINVSIRDTGSMIWTS